VVPVEGGDVSKGAGTVEQGCLRDGRSVGYEQGASISFLQLHRSKDDERSVLMALLFPFSRRLPSHPSQSRSIKGRVVQQNQYHASPFTRSLPPSNPAGRPFVGVLRFLRALSTRASVSTSCACSVRSRKNYLPITRGHAGPRGTNEKRKRRLQKLCSSSRHTKRLQVLLARPSILPWQICLFDTSKLAG
jgi:hypothetical protein